MLYFLHIPKSGGNSVRELFSRVYGEKLVGVYKAMDDAYAASLKPLCQKDSVLFGHYSFSLHLRLGDPDAEYMTILRNPVDRVISWYKWVARHPDHSNYERIHRDRLTVAEAVQQGIGPQVNNHAVRILSGNCRLWPVKHRVLDYWSVQVLGKQLYQMNGKRYLDVAIANLNRHFCFVGIVERMDQLTEFLVRRGVKAAEKENVERVNVTPPMEIAIDSHTLEVIRKANELDLMLYEQIAGKIHRGEPWYPVEPTSRSPLARFNVARLAIPRQRNAGSVSR
jgi:hypothetical protein